LIIDTSVGAPNSRVSIAIIPSVEETFRVLMRVHGDGCKQAFAGLVAGTTINVMTAADPWHAPAESITVTLVAFEDLVFCLAVRVAVLDIAVGSHYDED
jgi:hypothetical protein